MSTPSPLIKPILERIPLVGPLLRFNTHLQMFTPEEKKQLGGQYRDALGLGDTVTFSSEAFDAFEKASFREIKNFEKTQCPDGKTILEKLDAKFENNNKNVVAEHEKKVAYIKD